MLEVLKMSVGGDKMADFFQEIKEKLRHANLSIILPEGNDERQDNAVFGKEIGLDLPGTKRQLLVIVPGFVKAGVDFSQVTESDIKVNEENKTATLILPKPEFLGGPEILIDQVEGFSYEGLFREKADIKEGYEIAEDAKQMMIEETTGQGILELAEENAAKSVKEMFQLVDYDVEVEFKE